MMLRRSLPALLVLVLFVAAMAGSQELNTPLSLTPEGQGAREAPPVLLASSAAAPQEALAGEAGLGSVDPSVETGAAVDPAAPVALETASGNLGTTDAVDLWVNANDAYEAGEWNRALGMYLELRAAGIRNGHLEYNLGNAYLRSGQLGRAIASYRRALNFLPRDQDVMANLAFARQSARDAIAAPEPTPFLRTLFFWHFSASRLERAIGAFVLSVLLFGLLGLSLYRSGSEVLRWARSAAALLLVLVVGSLMWESAAPRRVAVIVPPEVDVRAGVDDESVVRFKLHAGTEVRALEARSDWRRVELPDGQQGWLREEHIELTR